MPDGTPTTKHEQHARPQHQPAAPLVPGPIQIEEGELLGAQRAVQDPVRAHPADVLSLQHVAGNRAVSRLIQTKLTVGPAHDRYEQEADHVAEQVLAMPGRASRVAGGVHAQRQVEEEEVQTKPLAATISPVAQRQPEEEELQMKPLVQRQPEEEEIQARRTAQTPTPTIQARGDGSFDAGSEVEGRLAAQQGGGQPLPGDVRAFMEPRFGADFSGVRIHTGGEAADLNRSLSAEAFTHGNDIYLGSGRYDPGTAAGNRLLAHELAHTIQQGASTVQTRRAPQPAAAVSAVASGMLQLKTAYVKERMHARLVVSPLDRAKTPKQQVKLIEGSPMGKEYMPLDVADIEDSDVEHVKDSGGALAWYKLQGQVAGKDQFLRSSKLAVTKTLAADFHKQGEAVETEGEQYSATEAAGEALGIPSDILGMEEAGKGQQTAAGVIGAAGGILGMVLGIKKVFASQSEVMDRVDGVFESLQSLMATGSGVSGTIVAATGTETTTLKEAATSGEKAGVAGAFFESFAGVLRGILGLIHVIKDGVELIKMLLSDQKYAKKEYAEKGTQMAQDMLDTAGGALSASKNIISLVTEVPTGVDQAVPGLDIALSAIKLIINGYYTIESAVHYHQMSKQKTQLEKETHEKEEAFVRSQRGAYRPAEDAARKVKEARDFFRQQEALAAMNRQLFQEADAEIKKLEAQQAKITGTDAKSTAKKKVIQAKIDAQTAKRNTYDQNARDAEDRMVAKENAMGGGLGETLTRKDLAELELATELTSANKKRIVRQSIHIGTELVKIAGAVTQLAAGATGVGAGVAVGLKAGAAGVDLSLPFFRAIKQYGRKKAAEQVIRGATPGSTKTTSVFAFEKSTAAKLQARKKHAIKILLMTANLPIPTADPATDRAEYYRQLGTFDRQSKQVELYIRATGVSPQKLYRLNGNPLEQVKLLATEMAMREFSAD